MNQQMEDIIYKYFKANRTLHFSPPDIISSEHYLSYRKKGENIIISIGSNDGEVEIGVFHCYSELDKAIERIIYGTLGR